MLKKIVIMLSLISIQLITVEPYLISSGFEAIPVEIKIEFFHPTVNAFLEDFKIDRNFKKLSREISKLRLCSKDTNETIKTMFSAGFIKNLTDKINNTSEFPVSRIALAKSLLTKDEFENYAKNNINWEMANETWTNFTKIPFFTVNNLKTAIKNDGNLDLRLDQEDNTALILAAKLGKLDIAELLIKGGANLDLQNNNGDTALIAAADNGHPYIVDLLAKAGANLNLQDIDGNTALMRDIEKTGFCTLALIRLGADVNIKNNKGDTALTLSIFKPWFIKPLIKAGADINATNNEGDTALIKASCSSTNTEDISNTSMTAALLITNCANLDIQNKLGNTALMTAIINSRDFIARMLIEEGANLNKQNNNGDTALSLAINSGNNEIINLLASQQIKH